MKWQTQIGFRPPRRAPGRMICILALLAAALFVGSPASANPDPPAPAPSSAGYRLARSVLAMGGGPKASAGYQVWGTAGQTMGVGWLGSAGYRVCSGYWSADAGSLLPLAAPSDLVAVPFSQTQMALAWQDNASGETAYYIERSVDGSSGWAVVGTAGPDATTYGDEGLTCGTTYYYRVRAYRAGDGVYSGYSNVAGGTTAPCGDGHRLYLPLALRRSGPP